MRSSTQARLVLTTFLVAGCLAGAVAPAAGQTAPAPGPAPVSLTARLEDVRLFDQAIVSGTLTPPHPGMWVDVVLLRGGNRVERTQVPLSEDGASYRAELPVEDWGTYRAQVSFTGDADHAPSTVTTDARRVRTPRPMSQGANGDLVLVLERRLEELRYHVPRPNRSYDHRTADAVLAFRKVQGLPRGESVTKATWRRLADPRTPRPRAKRPKVHIEVDQTKQVLYVVRQGEIEEIVHVSTGAGGATRDGVFSVHRKIAGYSPGRLYYPSYFDGNRAVHGWPEVPPTPASHGCVRVPYWVAKWIHGIMHYGMQVRVYH